MEPWLGRYQRELHEANAHGSDGAKYFLMMIRALSRGGFSPNEVFPVFEDLFERRQLTNCKKAITSTDFFFLQRPLHPGLTYRFMCSLYKTCKGDGRKPNTLSPPPDSEEDYSMTDIFFSSDSTPRLFGF
jgi:hypothetical protein